MPYFRFLLVLICGVAFPSIVLAADRVVPATKAAALDGHSISLPHDLANATILILGFSKDSADATKAWENAIGSMPADPAITFYNMPMLASAPGFIRPMIMRTLRKQIPDAAKPHFVPLTENESAWKSVADYASGTPDAAYVLLVDHSGVVRWQTHESFSQQGVQALVARARQVAGEPRATH